MQSSPGRQALALAAEGRSAEALALVHKHASEGDSEALFVRGLWRIEGKLIARDLGQARQDLALAADKGRTEASRILSRDPAESPRASGVTTRTVSRPTPVMRCQRPAAGT